jgi:hypothetical protein
MPAEFAIRSPFALVLWFWFGVAGLYGSPYQRRRGDGKPPPPKNVQWAMLLAASLGPWLYVLALLLPGRLRVGDDGLWFGWLGFRRFVAWEEVARVERVPETGAVSLVLSDERVLPLNPYLAGTRFAELAARIEQAHRAFAERPRAEPRNLARGGRALRVWLEDVENSLDEAGYREQGFTRADLRIVLDDAGAPPTARAAAARVLARFDEELPRIRVAASRTAAPATRSALEQAAARDERELEETFSALADRER